MLFCTLGKNGPLGPKGIGLVAKPGTIGSSFVEGPGIQGDADLDAECGESDSGERVDQGEPSGMASDNGHEKAAPTSSETQTSRSRRYT